jgi:hypothetical protein
VTYILSLDKCQDNCKSHLLYSHYKNQGMEKNIKAFVFLIVSWFFIAASCKKDKTPSSELITVNNQTFGCRVNGTPFIADKWDYGNNIPPIHVNIWYDPVGKYHYLIANGNMTNSYIEVFLNPPLISGRRELKFKTRSYPTVAIPKDYGLYQIQTPSKEYITNDTLGGYVDIISVDTINQKIEARFEFTGVERTTGEKVSVTNGYFKV